jgi:hypothetical protein
MITAVLGRPGVAAVEGDGGAATETDGIEGGVGSDGGLADGTDGALGNEGVETDTGICTAGAGAGGGGAGGETVPLPAEP